MIFNILTINQVGLGIGGKCGIGEKCGIDVQEGKGPQSGSKFST